MANWFSRKSKTSDVNSGEEVRSELPISGSPYQPINASTLEGTTAGAVSAERAVGLAGVYRAVTVLSTSISQLELGVYRNGVELPQPSTSLIARPDLNQPRAAFLEETVTSLATSGNAYWLLNKTGPTETVQNVTVLDPQRVHIEDKDGKRYYNYGDKRYQAWQVKHLKLTRLPGYTYGVGPIQTCQNELRGALDLRNYADNWFQDGIGKTKVILKTENKLQPGMGQQYADTFMDAVNSGNGVIALDSGINVERWAINPAEAQWIENQQFSTLQIARMFGIPAQYLMTDPGNSSTYTNMQDVDTAFVRYTLTRYINEIEAAFGDLLPRGQEAKFNVDGLLRANTAARIGYYKTAIDAGIMTADEARELEGLPPLTANTSEGPTTESDQ